jgi:hypothetical protein
MVDMVRLRKWEDARHPAGRLHAQPQLRYPSQCVRVRSVPDEWRRAKSPGAMVRSIIIEVAIMVAIGVVLAMLGPFDSYRIGDFAARLAYWLPASLIGYAIFRPTTWLAHWLAERLQLPLPASLVGSVAVGAIPGTIAVALLGGYRWSTLPAPTRLLPLYFNVFLLGLLIIGLFLLIERTTGAAVGAERGPVARPALLDRLSPGFAAPVRALEMEDHYVRAHGADGRSELVLMRMRDAVAELGDAEGERVHRSWWVARTAVVGKRREGRDLVLLLDDGRAVPVARDRTPALRAKGWL